MIVAWLIAATIEAMAWRQPRPGPVVQVQEEHAPEPAPTPVEPPVVPPAEAIVPPPPPESVPEPAEEPIAEAAPREEAERPQDAEPPPEEEPPPAPEPKAPPVPVAPAPSRQEPPRERPEPRPEAASPVAESPLVAFRPRTFEPRRWNIWDLERIAREQTREHPERRDELAFLFVHLRQFADADGSLPAEFDALVRETFGGLLEQPHS